MRRYCVNLSDEAAAVWGAYQASHPGLKRDPALDALLLEFGGLKPPEPVEPEEPTKYNVEVGQIGDNILVRSGTKTLLSTTKTDAANAFQKAVEAVPPGGSLGIGEGLYELPALYPFALDADGSNIFHCCIPILDKSMHISDEGEHKGEDAHTKHRQKLNIVDSHLRPPPRMPSTRAFSARSMGISRRNTSAPPPQAFFQTRLGSL